MIGELTGLPLSEEEVEARNYLYAPERAGHYSNTLGAETTNMKKNLSLHRRLLWLVAMLVSCRPGGEVAFAEETVQKGAANSSSVVKFRPATTGAPSVRVTGGSRGTGDATVTLDVLAPDEIGVTTQEQPSLFWFQSKPADAKFELTLLQENKVKPIVQVLVERSTKAGIQRLKLSEHGAKLTPGVEYQWVVALVTDPENRSSDLVASGVIKRVEPTADLKGKITNAAPASLAAVYAEAGIWYDALSVLSDQIEAQPENKSLRETRSGLLRQVGLKAAADSERASLKK